MVSYEIAIVVPVYNAHRHLRQCIKSILAQSFRAFSLVLVDDGSTDQSGIICDKFALKDERVHVIHQDNRGSVAARRTGVLSEWAQNAKYIFISDADDEIERDALRKLYNIAETNELDCVCGRTVRMWKGIRIPQSVSQSVSQSSCSQYC